jgi:hypothetical protein
MIVEKASDGWFVKHESGFVHLTADWVDQIHKGQFAVHGIQNPDLNWLRYHLRNGDPSAEEVAERFQVFYGEIRKNRQDRANLGLKAVTRHGHADLEAVREGEPVRPWNAADQKSELHEWIKARKGQAEPPAQSSIPPSQ